MQDLGFSAFFAEAFVPHAVAGLSPARVAVEHRGAYVCSAASGDLIAEVAGRLRHRARGRADLPAVGDWVAVEERVAEGRATIHAVLPRRTAFVRADVGKVTDAQVLAANVDTVFLVAALARDLAATHRRLERYLALAIASGAEPVFVLTKADLASDADEGARGVRALAPSLPLHVTSAVSGEGVGELYRYLAPGRTVAFLGPSGAGKSTLINHLCGSALFITREVDEFGVGRHASVRRELVRLPGGGLVLDTPGLREIPLWLVEDGVALTYADVAALADRCRFRDCAHRSEPGCAIAAAIADGTLEGARLAAWRDLERELAHVARKLDKRVAAEAKRAWRTRNRAWRARERPG